VIEERAVVVAREGEHAWVERERQSACGSCAANKGCGTGVLGKVVGRRYTRLRVLNPVGAQPGEDVVLGLDERALVRGSLALYLTPLAALFAFALLGEVLAGQVGVRSSDGFVALFATAGFVASLAWLRIFSRRLAGDTRYQAVILRREPAAVSLIQANKDLA
jgi:sigma-E factor negative regulatory protein RseC